MQIASRSMRCSIIFSIMLVCVASGNNETKSKERVVLVAPVLAPPKSSRARVTETAKDFPVLMLLANDQNVTQEVEPKVQGEPRPIYVKKLEDHKDQRKRRRRFSKIVLIRRRP